MSVNIANAKVSYEYKFHKQNKAVLSMNLSYCLVDQKFSEKGAHSLRFKSSACPNVQADSPSMCKGIHKAWEIC